MTYRLATWALSSGWELPDKSLISFAIWSNIAGEKEKKGKGQTWPKEHRRLKKNSYPQSDGGGRRRNFCGGGGSDQPGCGVKRLCCLLSARAAGGGSCCGFQWYS